MKGSGQIIQRPPGSVGRIEPRWNVMSRASRYLKALLVAMILFAGAPVSASHANAHFGDAKSQIAISSVNSVDTSEQDSDSDGAPLGGIEHHSCYSPCLDAFPHRSSYVTAYLEGTGIRYPLYLDALGPARDPDPLHKPPRFSVSA